MKIFTTNLIDEQRKVSQVLDMPNEGLDYEQWLTVRDVASQGRKTRAAGHTVPREHHLLSDLETQFFLLSDFAPDVIDIREQFPLLPIERTIQIAQDMGIRHPTNRRTTQRVVMTTDFLLTRQDRKGHHRYHAYSIKPSSRLTENSRRRIRTLEKLEIERRLWQSLHVPWTLVTEQAFDPTVIANLQWLSYGSRDLTPELIVQLPSFLAHLAKLDQSSLTLAQLLTTLANQLDLDDQDVAQQLFCHGVWQHHLMMNLHRPIALSQPTSFRLSPALQARVAHEPGMYVKPEIRHA
ncbi:TnsA endonuclease N-terminal domain-containing protein [Chromobacterium vaccinii]|uniref:TnsA endonuclease N-terminal domain-containing protein n=1 Tax=Chromobacterium vaccinii TaxID=1108595 RepID=A0ABV0FC80_9NEIS